MSSVKKEKFKAVIFDMDGVLIDSELIWFQKYHQLLALLAPSLSISVHKNLLGRSIEGIYDYLYDNYEGGLKIKNKRKFFKEYENFGISYIYNCTNLLFNADQVLAELKKCIPLALASSSPWTWINQSLELHNLQKYFKVVVSGQDLKKAKPNPDIYLKTAKELNCNPEDCLVIEDSVAGVEAGKNAKMQVLGLRNGFNHDQNLEKADKIINHLKEIIKVVC
ncbi:hypothetical protein A2331_05515 [Candidatus Falkowbacteria bacterium RIFOXYB2_FULL_34_18]|uniref:Haloacid dehalogenase n=1 Tax=Candidatus Falkowbacteria bacterium RIFOXYD2_FULL_34_120 TaxID=1798007 RepID=A0A1F5TR70_9BACT|nr:MAG: hypothetical protein A2331_05515 [Candidatus Falkowbacteria bacterium RIFOXYB2_FULL_34_18]OGF29834.1 MAG: hypothetical protein A2500_01515 [Candidatus Falkowbacteria bacterium RIFOXYC12_FULL_34_55]OGF37051.1 MAG: hypothetical protein A2466_05690 [Candidatus Falkowbacteria bacterium RIFOXYC2_FULL_34_220]OGF39243.1 MAG: hypothetical protein A2515_00900 [Candidatus Falkowbacteria bacterium RIFOXYD12_FULL_34_57]OGF41348.1 MAG: hypothetical protein A2531_07110 [Candidatus Falkowbacteria bact